MSSNNKNKYVLEVGSVYCWISLYNLATYNMVDLTLVKHQAQGGNGPSFLVLEKLGYNVNDFDYVILIEDKKEYIRVYQEDFFEKYQKVC